MATPIIKDRHIVTSKDHPGKIAVVFYVSTRRCTLDCFHCHNKQISEENNEYAELSDIIRDTNDAKLMGAELVIISGGEPTLYSLDLVEVIKAISVILPVRIDTNGLHPGRVEFLKNYVSGFAIDIKLPLEIETNDRSTYCDIIGAESLDKLSMYRRNVSQSIRLVDGMENTVFRTVKYPLLSKLDIKNIEAAVNSLQSPHYFNPFYEVDK